MIRTQPCDILCWSAAYFRCIANNVQPPTKSRFEGDSIEGHLTKEFLKTLVKQIGKGYFVDRELLQMRWKGLGLPEHELIVLLAACGMLDRDIVHWMKLVAVMAGSISEVFLQICWSRQINTFYKLFLFRILKRAFIWCARHCLKMLKGDRAQCPCGCSMSPTHFLPHSMEVLSTRKITQYRTCNRMPFMAANSFNQILNLQ